MLALAVTLCRAKASISHGEMQPETITRIFRWTN